MAKAYRSFQEIGGAPFIYGHSLAENDEHYLKLIECGKVSHVFVGIDPTSEGAEAVVRRANLMRENRGAAKATLEVTFYDAASARVWGRSNVSASK